MKIQRLLITGLMSAVLTVNSLIPAAYAAGSSETAEAPEDTQTLAETGASGEADETGEAGEIEETEETGAAGEIEETCGAEEIDEAEEIEEIAEAGESEVTGESEEDEAAETEEAEVTEEIEEIEAAGETEEAEESWSSSDDMNLRGHRVISGTERKAEIYVRDEEGLAEVRDYPSSYSNVDNLPDRRVQGSGNCWAYGTMAAVEADAITEGIADRNVDLSEMHMVYFASHYNNDGVTDPLGGTAGDKVTYNSKLYPQYDYYEIGGNAVYSTQILANWTGAVDQDSAPDEYTASSDTKIDADKQYEDSIYHVQGIYELSQADQDTLKQMIMEHGAVMFSYYDDDRYYDEENNSYYCPDTRSYGNHEVALVGWDDNFSASDFSRRPDTDGAWIVRNTWGGEDEWSHNGYFYLSYNDASCILNAYSCENTYALDVESADNYDNNYQYDGGIIFSYYGLGNSSTNSSKGANVFTASASQYEQLEAVAFETCGCSNVDYTVCVYKNPTDSGNPESGTLAATVSGKTTLNGYYTVRLDNPVSLSKGDVFTCVVTLSGDDSAIGLEGVDEDYVDWLNDEVSMKSGQSYYCSNGSWTDLKSGRYSQYGNLRIKAFTSNSSSGGSDSGADEDGLSLTLSSYSMKLEVGESASVTAFVSDSSASMEWSVDDSDVVSMEQTLSTQVKLTGLTPGSAVLKVEASVSGVTVTKYCEIAVSEKDDSDSSDDDEDDDEDDDGDLTDDDDSDSSYEKYVFGDSNVLIAKSRVDISGWFSGFQLSGLYKTKYVSSNNKILSVNKKGIARVKNRGDVTVSLLYKLGNVWVKAGEASFEVEEPYINPSFSPATGYNMNDSLCFATYAPTEWYSSKVQVVYVDPSTGEMTLTGSGKAVIYAVYGSGSNSTKKKYKVKVFV